MGDLFKVGGRYTNAYVNSEGKLEVAAAVEVGDVTVELPGVYDKLDTYSVSMLGGATTTAVAFTNVTTGFACIVACDGSGSASVRFNTTSNPSFTVKIGESYTVDNFEFTKIYIANASATTTTAIRMSWMGA